MTQKKASNRDLTIRRRDGSFFNVSLPVWFDKDCKFLQGDRKGNMQEVFMIAYNGTAWKLNIQTREFEEVPMTEHIKELMRQQIPLNGVIPLAK